MKININIKFSGEDSLGITESNNILNLEIGSITNSQKEQYHCSNNIFSLFQDAKLIPSEMIIDILNLSLAVYSVDQLISRNKYGYYNWNRYFELCLPVFELDKWKSIVTDLSETLSFLSGDKWNIILRSREAYYSENIETKNKDIDKVSLFSGGLDSLIGAIDFLNNKEKVVLVGHHRRGSIEKNFQENLIQNLETEFSANIESFLFYVQPEFEKQKKILLGEDTQRARSFLFLGLGIAIANSYGRNVKLMIPENGLISLNIPLTPTRLGTYSTKTTHPYFLTRFMDILEKLGIYNKIENPYQFKTKGEMIVDCQVHNKDIIAKLANQSISCSKPGHYKRWRRKGTPDVNEEHCGHCVPCIIRRAAMYKGNLDEFKGNYAYDVKTFDKTNNKGKGSDLHAFNIGIQKYLTQNKLTIFELLKSGALPEEDINSYMMVARNGYEEVNEFILNK